MERANKMKLFYPLDPEQKHWKPLGYPLKSAVDSEALRSKVSLRVSPTAPQAPKGSVSPVGWCAKRKAPRRREQIQGLRAASAQNFDICEQGKRVLSEKAAAGGLFRHAGTAPFGAVRCIMRRNHTWYSIG